jgi:predicted nucleic acid-binding protein
MIVVDANVLIYLWVPGYDKLSPELLMADPEWHAPVIWLSEVRNVLLTHYRHRLIGEDDVLKTMSKIERQMLQNTHVVTSAEVFRVGLKYGISAYDGEYVSLARRLQVQLITHDHRLIKAIPDVAIPPDAFVGK